MFYKNFCFENILFDSSDRKSKDEDKNEDHCSDKDKINHLFYPLGILQKVLAELRKNSTAIYFSQKLMLESRQIVAREFFKDFFFEHALFENSNRKVAFLQLMIN